MFVFGKAAGLFRFSFGDLLAETLDCSGPVGRHPAFETAIYRINFGDLFLREISAISGDGALLLEIQKMAPVRRQRFYEIHRDRMLDNIALARKITR